VQVPMQLTFRHMPPSAALEDDIRERVRRLDDVCDRLIRCRVLVEAPHHSHHQGNLFHVRVELTVPGREIVVNREPEQHHAHEDAHVAIRDAFDAAARRLEDWVREVRGQTKNHEPPPRGRVARLFPDEDFGFIETPEGTDVYFHRNSVVTGDFDRLHVGDEVRFTPETGVKGPQASSVHVTRRAAD